MNEQEREREAREALERVRRDSESIGSSALARMSRQAQDHFSGRDAHGAAEDGGTDAIELWGRRIGRGLSLVGVVVLGLWLLVQLGIL
jgi:ferric-dicitrate binding protein FerR (iron transport regulator)